MNKWKGSLGLKGAAWVGITLCALLFAGSVCGIVLLLDSNFYEYSEQELREDAFSSVAKRYSMMALLFMMEDREYDWDSAYFHYGIIQAKELGDLSPLNVDFNDPDTYIESNFTEDVSEEELYRVYQELGEDTLITYSESLFGNYGVWGRAAYEAYSMPIAQICYNREDGIFYYETQDGFYPVLKVAVTRSTEAGEEYYLFRYDFEQRKYWNIQASDTTYNIENNTEKNADDILRMKFITFDMFDDTDWNVGMWESVTLDDTTYWNNGDILWVSNLYLTDSSVTEENYSIVEGRIHVSTVVTMTPYWVVSILPTEVGTDWNGNLFEQANFIVTLGWTMRYSVYLIMILSLAVGIALFVFLMYGAGHRKNRQEIVTTWLDRIPFDLYLAAAFIVIGIFLVVPFGLGLGLYYWENIMFVIIVVTCVLCVGWLTLLTFLTLATRVKLGKWWRNTLIWRIYDKLRHMAAVIYQNMSLFGKVFLLMGGLALLEFVGIYFTILSYYYRAGVLLILWFFEKLLLNGVVFAAVLQMKRLKEGGNKLAEGDLTHRVDTTKMFWEFKKHGESLNSISVGMSRAVDERMKSERFKTELITNVSHDIKTPLTSIINYVDLLGKEELGNENAAGYVEVLKRQSGRLKKLIDDLMEASKASTGNLTVNMEELEAGVSMVQTVGEFEEKLQANGLELLIRRPEERVYIMADSRHLWRVIDNLMNNICKYAQPNTRVYINLEEQGGNAILTFRNTSKYPLNITSEELMERFVRGDSSRNTEGSGLGLSIARSLTELMGGRFELYIDGDLFKVVLIIPKTSKMEAK